MIAVVLTIYCSSKDDNLLRSRAFAVFVGLKIFLLYNIANNTVDCAYILRYCIVRL